MPANASSERKAAVSGVKRRKFDHEKAAPPIKESEMAKLERGEDEETISWFSAMTTYLGYAVLIVFGHLRDFFGKLTGWSRYFGGNNAPPKGWAPLLKDWENFYTRRLYHRIQDCWNRPIDGPPLAGGMDVLCRTSKDGNFSLDGEAVNCLNLGSYNYLGFADDWDETCRESVMGALDRFAPSLSSAAAECGTTDLHVELERCVREFVGKEAAIVFNMGYGTNATALPALLGKGCLVFSDSLNHTSIVNGARASGAMIRVFRHNDVANLEALLRDAIIMGQPRTHRPWRKIVVIVEGIYSMEGEICDLRTVVDVTRKYGAYLYLDEAHSIGALGRTGRGACEVCGVDPSEVDVLMGTFTKSFGAMGGYIAGSKELIDYLRANASGSLYGDAMSPVVAQQILAAFRVIDGKDGTDIGAKKLAAVRNNANYFRSRLIEMGCDVYGDWGSPVVPIMLYNPAKIAAFSRECFARGLAVVVVGFPATPLVLSRARFCVSAGHTKEDLDKALDIIDEVCNVLHLKYKKYTTG